MACGAARLGIENDGGMRFTDHMATTPTSASFMLLFRNGGPETHGHLDAEGRARLAKQWNDWYDGLAARGKVTHGQPLALTGRMVTGAARTVIDGPYAEAKETVAGYFMLNVADLDEATAIAKECPSLSLGVTVEIRPIATISPVLEKLQGRPPSQA